MRPVAPASPTDLAHWSGPIGTPSGETIDTLSDPNPLGLGIVHEGLDSLGLDITVNGYHEGQWCDVPGVKLNCPTLGANKPWDTILVDPARLELTCNEVSPDSAEERITVNVTGLLEEAREAPAGG